MDNFKKYIRQAQALKDIFNFIVLRYARTHPFGGTKFLPKLMGQLYPDLVLRSKIFKGLKLIINPADLSHAKITDEFFLENIYNLGIVDFTPDHIIDCGAHVGMFTLLSAAHFPNVPVYSFEPNAYNLTYLKKQVAINKLLNVYVHESAVSTYNGETTFANPDGTTFGGYIERNTSALEGQKVKVENLIEFVENLKAKKLLLKVDIEGEEQEIMPLLLHRLPTDCIIFFEYHFGLEAFKNFEKLFNDNNFKVKINRVIEEKYIDAVATR